MKDKQWLIVIGWGLLVGICELFAVAANEPILNWIIAHPIIWVLLLSWSWAYLEGDREGVCIDAQERAKPNTDVNHVIFTVQRGMVFMLFASIVGWANALLLVVMFPFIHDGQYYVKREELNPGVYPYKWFDQSTTSKDYLTRFFTPIIRTALFGLALITYILIAIYK